jgi:hypothetical protein
MRLGLVAIPTPTHSLDGLLYGPTAPIVHVDLNTAVCAPEVGTGALNPMV